MELQQESSATEPHPTKGRPRLEARVEQSLMVRLQSTRGLELMRFERDIRFEEDLRMDYIDTTCLMLDAALEIPEIQNSRLLDGSRLKSLRTLGEVCDVLLAAADGKPDGVLDLNLPFDLVRLKGSFYQMGRLHAETQQDAIRECFERFIELLGPKIQSIPELKEALATREEYFGAEELEELEGIADGLGVEVEHVLGLNFGLYPAYLPGCCQFAVTKKANGNEPLLHCVNEDSPITVVLKKPLARIGQIRYPEGFIPHLTFGVAGQVGGLNGINAAGLAVSTTLLMDRPRREGTDVGLIHPVIVKRILESADSIEPAVNVVRGIHRVGGWSLCLSHYPTDKLCYLEYDGKVLRVEFDRPSLISTNHAEMFSPLEDVPVHSVSRFERLKQLLDQGQQPLTVQHAQAVLRDGYDWQRGRITPHATMHTIRRVDNQSSIVMRPETGEMWVTPGPNSPENADRYYRIDLNELFQSGKPVLRMGGTDIPVCAD